MAKRKTNELFEKELAEKNARVVNLEPYAGARTKIMFMCQKCGYSFRTTPDSVLRGSGCAKCAGTIRKTQDEFIKQVSEANPKIEVLGTYVNNRTRVRCKCLMCGYEWDGDPVYLTTGSNCPNCVHSGTSLIEQCIFILFEDLFGEGRVDNRNKTEISKELDIYVPVNRIAVEYGSWFWHKEKAESDYSKIIECQDKGIDLVIVYDSYDGTLNQARYGDGLLTYKENLSNDNDKLKSMLEDLLSRFNLESVISYDYLADIKRRAYKNCSKKSTELFKEEISIVNPSITIIGEYKAARKKITCECNECGHQWNALVFNLLRGAGCPKCGRKSAAGKQLLSHEEFMSRIQGKLNENVIIIGKYSNAHNKIRCKCKICNYEWDALPGDLHHGSGCPKCGGTMKRTHGEFIDEMKTINPEITVLGLYSTHNTPIECSCKKCGYNWYPRPKHLLSGHGCPKCNGRLKKTTDDIKNEIKARSMPIEMIGDYINDNHPIHLKCQVCGYEWEQRVRHLLNSRGCPNCYPYTEAQEKRWNDFYNLAKEYYFKYGNIDIPARADYKGVRLGQWIHKQREAYRNSLRPLNQQNKKIGFISQKRINLLNDIEMKW